MLGTAIEMHLDCPRCEQPVHVNALSTRVTCARCDAEIPITWGTWKTLLDDSFARVRACSAGEGSRVRATLEGAVDVDLLYARFDPHCFACKRPFDAAGAARDRVDGLRCEGCGALWHARGPTVEQLRHFPALSYLFAEAPGQVLDAFGRPADLSASVAAEGVDPIVFACPKCGGGLEVDGSDRMVSCAYCAASVYLPDDLWRRLHPAPVKQRWFLWWDPRRLPTEPSHVEAGSGEATKADAPHEAQALHAVIADEAQPRAPTVPPSSGRMLASALAIFALLTGIAVATGVYVFMQAEAAAPKRPTAPR